jgi:hypothetical protein
VREPRFSRVRVNGVESLLYGRRGNRRLETCAPRGEPSVGDAFCRTECACYCDALAGGESCVKAPRSTHPAGCVACECGAALVGVGGEAMGVGAIPAGGVVWRC